MSNRFVYFYRVRKEVKSWSSTRIAEVQGIAQLPNPIVSQKDLDDFMALVGILRPELAPVEMIHTLTFLHRENVADEQ